MDKGLFDAGQFARDVFGPRSGNSLFYFPTHDEPATPAKWGFRYEDVRFTSADGTGLHGWWIRQQGRQAKGTVVFSHGNAGSMGHHLGFVMWLAEAGYQVLMFDYRGFGKSGGSPDRRGMIDDVRAAFTYAASRSDAVRGRLVSFGHSLGGAKSVVALAEKPVPGLTGVVVDGAFASYQAMARIIAGDVGASVVTDEWAPRDHVARLAPVPLLVVHGRLDRVVPFTQGKELFDRAALPKTMFAVKNGTHGSSLVRDGGAYRKRMLAWLEDR